MRLLSKVKHRNLVGLVGYCEEPGMHIYIYIFDYQVLPYSFIDIYTFCTKINGWIDSDLVGSKGGKVLVYEYVPNGSLLDYIMGMFLN